MLIVLLWKLFSDIIFAWIYHLSVKNHGNHHMSTSHLFMPYYELSAVHDSWNLHYISLWLRMNTTMHIEHLCTMYGSMLETPTNRWPQICSATLLLHSTQYIGKVFKLIYLARNGSPLLSRISDHFLRYALLHSLSPSACWTFFTSSTSIEINKTIIVASYQLTFFYNAAVSINV